MISTVRVHVIKGKYVARQSVTVEKDKPIRVIHTAIHALISTPDTKI